MKIYKIANINYIHDFRSPQGAYAIIIQASGKYYAYVLSGQKEIDIVKKLFKETPYTKYPGGKAIKKAKDLATQAFEVTSDFPRQGSKIIRDLNDELTPKTPKTPEALREQPAQEQLDLGI